MLPSRPKTADSHHLRGSPSIPSSIGTYAQNQTDGQQWRPNTTHGAPAIPYLPPLAQQRPQTIATQPMPSQNSQPYWAPARPPIGDPAVFYNPPGSMNWNQMQRPQQPPQHYVHTNPSRSQTAPVDSHPSTLQPGPRPMVAAQMPPYRGPNNRTSSRTPPPPVPPLPPNIFMDWERRDDGIPAALRPSHAPNDMPSSMTTPFLLPKPRVFQQLPVSAVQRGRAHSFTMPSPTPTSTDFGFRDPYTPPRNPYARDGLTFEDRSQRPILPPKEFAPSLPPKVLVQSASPGTGDSPPPLPPLPPDFLPNPYGSDSPVSPASAQTPYAPVDRSAPPLPIPVSTFPQPITSPTALTVGLQPSDDSSRSGKQRDDEIPRSPTSPNRAGPSNGFISSPENVAVDLAPQDPEKRRLEEDLRGRSQRTSKTAMEQEDYDMAMAIQASLSFASSFAEEERGPRSRSVDRRIDDFPDSSAFPPDNTSSSQVNDDEWESYDPQAFEPRSKSAERPSTSASLPSSAHVSAHTTPRSRHHHLPTPPNRSVMPLPSIPKPVEINQAPESDQRPELAARKWASEGGGSGLPQYEDVVRVPEDSEPSGPVEPVAGTATPPRPLVSLTPSVTPQSNAPAIPSFASSNLLRTESANATLTTTTTAPSLIAIEEGARGVTSRSRSASAVPTVTQDVKQTVLTPPITSLATSRDSAASSSSSDLPLAAPTPPPLINNEIFVGVSYGFGLPSPASFTTARTSAFPDVVTLSPQSAFHILAPNFRHLLRLLAQLSRSTLEPTPGAIASSKSSQLSLRSTLLFVRSGSEWRTVLWLEIDTEVPADLPNRYKWTNNDTAQLPYQTAIPPTVRHAPQSGSLIYTFPSPLPTLPIQFPNLAMYLQSSMADSKKAADSSGTKRLSKIVDQCYPHQKVSKADEIVGAERVGHSRSVGSGLIARVMGRKDKNKGGTSANEDTYDLVTPFRLDEWG